MNSVTQPFLETLHNDLLPVRGVIERLASDVNLEPETGALRLSHRPKVGAEAYACVLYPGVDTNLIDRYERIHRARIVDYLDIPLLYRNLLTRLNGADLFGIALYGIPLSMAQDPPLLNRSVQQPLDVSTANETWRLEYRVPRSNFYFGGGPHSSQENRGYFLTPKNQVEAFLVGGKKIGEWQSMATFLAEEIDRAESIFPEFERIMEDARLASKAKRRGR